MLPPLLIFNAKPNGRVEKELGDFPPGAHYAVQKNAWMDERVMLMWVDVILAPYIKTAPDGVRPILFLDSYRCHMMASVVQRAQDLGVEVIHIPGGCTGVCQPVDVGIGKPFKDRVTRCWETWMVESGGLEEKKTKTPSRQELSEWVIQSLKSIGTTIVRNSWRRHGFSFFPGEDSIGSDDGHGSNDDGAENHPDDDYDSDEDSIIFATDYVFGHNKCVAISAEITTENAEEKVDDDSMDDEN
jgi:hypothetical protein